MRSILLVALLVFSLAGCEQPAERTARTLELSFEQMDIKEAVWKQLTRIQKEQINGKWENAKVSIIKLGESEGTEAYQLLFPKKNVFKPENIIVYADHDSHQIIGFGFVE
jgi:hypothetical protein